MNEQHTSMNEQHTNCIECFAVCTCCVSHWVCHHIHVIRTGTIALPYCVCADILCPSVICLCLSLSPRLSFSLFLSISLSIYLYLSVGAATYCNIIMYTLFVQRVVRLIIGILYALMAVLTIFWIHLQGKEDSKQSRREGLFCVFMSFAISVNCDLLRIE